MTRDEYRELAALWGDSTPADDQREVEQLALRTRGRARMAQWGELAVVALLFAGIAAAIMWNSGPATLLTGGLLLVLLAWSGWKRHRLADVALMIDERDRLSFIRSSVMAKAAELRRSALGLALILPGIVISMLWGFSLLYPGGENFFSVLAAVMTSPRKLAVFGLVFVAVLILSRSHMRIRRELTQLRRLQEEYCIEARRDDYAG